MLPDKTKGEIGVTEFRLQVQQAFYGLAGLRDVSDKRHRKYVRKVVRSAVKDADLKVIGMAGESTSVADADDVLDDALDEVMETSTEPPEEKEEDV